MSPRGGSVLCEMLLSETREPLHLCLTWHGVFVHTHAAARRRSSCSHLSLSLAAAIMPCHVLLCL